MTSLIVISILGFVVIIGAVSMGVVFSTVIKAFITKTETTVKNDTVSEYDKIKADVNGFINRTETNVKASILNDEVFLNSLNDKLKNIVK